MKKWRNQEFTGQKFYLSRENVGGDLEGEGQKQNVRMPILQMDVCDYWSAGPFFCTHSAVF
ncbi:MAG: hypothetical protein IJ710_02920 [Prevotella sp.]|nr:hypothetical protein [Prevotella sp.]